VGGCGGRSRGMLHLSKMKARELERRKDLLSNGAGKSFISRIFSTLHLDTNVRTSTTNDSLQPLQKREPSPLLGKEHVNLLSNGAGKSFVATMFSILDIEMNVRISTTNDPCSDWCGVDAKKVSGVVDVAVVSGGCGRL
jgi:hypothetical protein